MKLDPQDIAYAEKAEEERMEGEFYRLYFNRMTAIDMEIVCTIYNTLILPGDMLPTNLWFRNLLPANLWFRNLNA